MSLANLSDRVFRWIKIAKLFLLCLFIIVIGWLCWQVYSLTQLVPKVENVQVPYEVKDAWGQGKETIQNAYDEGKPFVEKGIQQLQEQWSNENVASRY